MVRILKISQTHFGIVFLACTIAVIGFFFTFSLINNGNSLARDFTYSWRAARYLLQGTNPFYEIVPTGNYPYDTYFLYPLPAVIYALPFTSFNAILAGCFFSGVNAGLLAYVILRFDSQKWPIFTSLPFFMNLYTVQWTPMLIAFALMPMGWQGLAATIKPSVGLVSFLYKPNLRSIVFGFVVLIVSLLILPTWPSDWVTSIMKSGIKYPVIILAQGGLLLAASLFWFRKPEGRVLFASSILPRHPFWYDSLFLWLIPKTWKQSLSLSILSWMAFFGWRLSFRPGMDAQALNESSIIWQMTLLYLPALMMVLYQNVKIPIRWRSLYSGYWRQEISEEE